MRRIAGLMALLCLLLPSTVDAKGIATVRVCGGDGCVTLPDRSAEVLTVTEEVSEPPPVVRYYRLEIAVNTGRQAQRHWKLYAPSLGLIAADAGAHRALLWTVPATEALNQLRPAVAKLEPFEAPAAWPPTVDEAPMTGPSVAHEVRWMPAVLTTALGLLTLGGLVLFAGRLRARRPKTA